MRACPIPESPGRSWPRSTPTPFPTPPLSLPPPARTYARTLLILIPAGILPANSVCTHQSLAHARFEWACLCGRRGPGEPASGSRAGSSPPPTVCWAAPRPTKRVVGGPRGAGAGIPCFQPPASCSGSSAATLRRRSGRAPAATGWQAGSKGGAGGVLTDCMAGSAAEAGPAAPPKCLVDCASVRALPPAPKAARARGVAGRDQDTHPWPWSCTGRQPHSLPLSPYVMPC